MTRQPRAPRSGVLADQRGHHRMNVIAVGDDRLGTLAQTRGMPLAKSHRIELDDIQVLTQLVVQLPRQVLTLGLLQQHILLRQAPVVGQGGLQLRLRDLTAPQLAPRARDGI